MIYVLFGGLFFIPCVRGYYARKKAESAPVAPAVAGGEGGQPVYAATVVPQQGAVYAATVVPQQQTISVTIPPDAQPGSYLTAPLPDGRTVQVAIPPGAVPGGTVQVAVPP